MTRMVLVLLVFACSAQAETTTFFNVSVIPMTDSSVLENQTVIVTDGVITTIGPVDLVPVPQGGLSIDGTDRYLLPALAEMHAHVARAGSRDLDRMLDLFIANGVTTIRGMLGHPSHLRLRDSLNSHEVLGPRLITSGPSLNGNSVDGARDGASKVRRQAEAGYDFVKLHPGLTRNEFAAIVDAAKQQQIPLAGHVSSAVGLQQALAAPMQSIDHLDGYLEAMLPADAEFQGDGGGLFGVMLADRVDLQRMDAVVQMTKASGVWIVPTQSLIEGLVSSDPPEQLANRPEMQFMPASTVASWVQSKRQLQSAGWRQSVADRAIEIRRELLRRLHASGVNLLLGSDAPQVFNVPGFSTHRELQLLVDVGFTPYAAMHTATVAAGKFLALDIGQIQPGYRADLLLLDDNPLHDIENLQRIHGVMVGGTWIGPERRIALMEKHRRLQ